MPPRTLRTTVWVVLGAWLFALAAGMANACLLEPQAALEHRHSRNDQDDRHVHAGHAVATDHHDESPSKAPCVKVCGEATQSPVQKASTATFDLTGLPALPYQVWTPAQRVDLNIDLSGDRLLIPPEPPPRLRFARLAL